jgi:hypothetical protein
LAHILKLKAHFPEDPIKTLRVDNAGEFTSHTFDDFCTASEIDVEHPIAYVHFQNGIAESLIKQLQVIARPMLMHSNLPPSRWGHTILHVAALIPYRPFAFNATSPHTLALGTTSNISHLRTFGYQVLVPIMGPKQSKHGPRRRKGIYVGFDSNSIIRYLEPTTADVYKARFIDCHFYEDVFSTLDTGKPANNPKDAKLTWQLDSPFWNDLHTGQAEAEVQQMLHLTRVMEQLPNSFADVAKIIKTRIPANNAPSRIDMSTALASTATPRKKSGRPVGATDKQLRHIQKAATPPSKI